MFETTELEKPIFQKLRDIMPGNWPILLKNSSVKKAKDWTLVPVMENMES